MGKYNDDNKFGVYLFLIGLGIAVILGVALSVGLASNPMNTTSLAAIEDLSLPLDRVAYGTLILENKYIDYSDILKLKGIEDLVEKYYNEGYFEHTLNYLIKAHYMSPCSFYEDLLEFWNSNHYHKVSHSRNKLYEILIEFINHREFEDSLYITQILKFDFTLNNKNSKLKLEYEENNDL